MPSKFSLVVLSSVCYWADRAGRAQTATLFRQVYSSSCSNKQAGHSSSLHSTRRLPPAHPPAHIPALPVRGRGCLRAPIAKPPCFLWLNTSSRLALHLHTMLVFGGNDAKRRNATFSEGFDCQAGRRMQRR